MYGAFADHVRREIDQIRTTGLYKAERQLHSPQAAEIAVVSSVGQESSRVLNFCANNYLGLSSHPDIIRAAHDGLDRRGFGMSSVRFICGTQDLHKQLEQRLSG